MFDENKLRDMRRQINTRLAEYTGSDTQLLSLNNDVKGAHLRMTNWVLKWQPSRPKLMYNILARLRTGQCDPLAPAVVVEGPDRFRLVLKIAIRDMLKEDGARLVAAGELEDVESVATKKSLERLGAVLLGVLVARARLWRYARRRNAGAPARGRSLPRSSRRREAAVKRPPRQQHTQGLYGRRRCERRLDVADGYGRNAPRPVYHPTTA